jgi:TP901 family phage tail tape measure protein
LANLDSAFDDIFVRIRADSRPLFAGMDRAMREAAGRSVALSIRADTSQLSKVEEVIGEIAGVHAAALTSAATGFTKALASGAGPVRAVGTGLQRAAGTAAALVISAAKFYAIQKGLAYAIQRADAANRPMLSNTLSAVKALHRYSLAIKVGFAAALLPVKALTAGLHQAGRAAGAVGGVGRGLIGSINPLAALGVAAGAGAGLGMMVSRAGDIRDSFIDLQKASGLAGVELEGFKQQVLDLASTVPGLKVDELSKIAIIGAKLGVPTAKLLDYTKAVAAASIAMDDVPVEEMATGLARLTNVFKMDADQAFYFASAVDKLADSSTTGGAAILDVGQRAGPAAAQLGMAADQFLGIATAALDAGMRAETAGTALSKIIGWMADPGKAEELGKVAGMTAQAFRDLAAQDAGGALLKVLEGLSSKSGFDQAGMLAEMGINDQQDRQALSALTSDMSKLARFTKMAGDELRTGGQVLGSMAINAGKASAMYDRLRGVLDNLADTVGGALLAPLEAGIQHINRLIAAMDNAAENGAAKRFGDAITGAIDAIAGAFERPEKVADVFVALLDVLQAIAIEKGLRIGESLAKAMLQAFGTAFQAGLTVAMNVGNPAMLGAQMGIASAKAGDAIGGMIGGASKNVDEAMRKLGASFNILRDAGAGARAGQAGAGAGIGSMPAAAFNGMPGSIAKLGGNPLQVAAAVGGMIAGSMVGGGGGKASLIGMRGRQGGEASQLSAQGQVAMDKATAEAEGKMAELFAGVSDRMQKGGGMGFSSAEDFTKSITGAIGNQPDYQREQRDLLKELADIGQRQEDELKRIRDRNNVEVV